MAKNSFSLTNEPNGLARRIASHRLFHRMMARQHINLNSVHRASAENLIYRALHTCSHCSLKADCAGWLAGTEPPATYIRFCPNAQTIEALRITTS